MTKTWRSHCTFTHQLKIHINSNNSLLHIFRSFVTYYTFDESNGEQASSPGEERGLQIISILSRGLLVYLEFTLKSSRKLLRFQLHILFTVTDPSTVILCGMKRYRGKMAFYISLEKKVCQQNEGPSRGYHLQNHMCPVEGIIKLQHFWQHVG